MVTPVNPDWRLMISSMKESWRGFAFATPGGRALERDGLVASVVPAVPERSVMNSVIYDDAETLRKALDELAASYDQAGVLAWTVWVPEHDRLSAQLLAAAGHVLDATPAAMVCDPAKVEPPPPGALELVDEPEFAQVADINDRAYGYPGRPFMRALGHLPSDGAHLYVAAVDGAPAACAVAQDHDDTDCGIYWVATLPEARGRGLAGALMRRAVADAHERGRTTSTLQATKLGQPVYERIGYRSIGTLQMWERRKPAQAGSRP
jgi:GNAT superfamily N-acetyltransferase